MTKRDYILPHIISVLIGGLVGFLLYAWASNLGLKFDTTISLQIDPLNIVTFLVSVLLAVYVLRKLNKKDEGERAERDLLIKQFTAFDSGLTEVVRNLLGKQGVEVDKVAAILKRNRMRAQALLKLAIEEELVGTGSAHAKALPNQIKKIQDLLTDTPKSGAVEDGIRVKDGKLYYSANHIDKVSNALFEMSSFIFRLSVEINRAPRS